MDILITKSICCKRCGLALDESRGVEIVMLGEKISALMNKLTEDPEKLQKLLSLNGG